MAPIFPGSAHVGALGLDTATDREIGGFAGEHGYLIVSKDSDDRRAVFMMSQAWGSCSPSARRAQPDSGSIRAVRSGRPAPGDVRMRRLGGQGVLGWAFAATVRSTVVGRSRGRMAGEAPVLVTGELARAPVPAPRRPGASWLWRPRPEPAAACRPTGRGWTRVAGASRWAGPGTRRAGAPRRHPTC